MERNVFNLKTVEKGTANVLKQYRSIWHKVRNAIVETVNMEVGIGTNIHQFLHALLGILTVLDGGNAVFDGCFHLHVIHVGKGVLERRDTVNAVFY